MYKMTFKYKLNVLHETDCTFLFLHNNWIIKGSDASMDKVRCPFFFSTLTILYYKLGGLRVDKCCFLRLEERHKEQPHASRCPLNLLYCLLTTSFF